MKYRNNGKVIGTYVNGTIHMSIVTVGLATDYPRNVIRYDLVIDDQLVKTFTSLPLALGAAGASMSELCKVLAA